jgi:hypothetical protein
MAAVDRETLRDDSLAKHSSLKPAGGRPAGTTYGFGSGEGVLPRINPQTRQILPLHPAIVGPRGTTTELVVNASDRL